MNVFQRTSVRLIALVFSLTLGAETTRAQAQNIDDLQAAIHSRLETKLMRFKFREDHQVNEEIIPLQERFVSWLQDVVRRNNSDQLAVNSLPEGRISTNNVHHLELGNGPLTRESYEITYAGFDITQFRKNLRNDSTVLRCSDPRGLHGKNCYRGVSDFKDFQFEIRRSSTQPETLNVEITTDLVTDGYITWHQMMTSNARTSRYGYFVINRLHKDLKIRAEIDLGKLAVHARLNGISDRDIEDVIRISRVSPSAFDEDHIFLNDASHNNIVPVNIRKHLYETREMFKEEGLFTEHDIFVEDMLSLTLKNQVRAAIIEAVQSN